MNLIFINPDHHDFNVLTPADQPLGGSQSGICYLCLALARRGHKIVLASATTNPGTFGGVQCIQLSQLQEVIASGNWDALVVLNRADCLRNVRRMSADGQCIVFWTGHNINQRELASLSDPDVRAACDRWVLVSEWHRAVFTSRFGIPAASTAVIRNAIAPVFETLFATREDLESAKSGHMTLAYTSAPFRGLALLLDVYSELIKRDDQVALQIYSSMAAYQRQDPLKLQKLYQKCQHTRGIAYSGSIAQPSLAGQLRRFHVLAYPNTFAETSCIAVMEAMSAGCLVITSDYAGLQETSAGYAMLVPVAFRSLQEYANDYFQTLAAGIRDWRNSRAQLLDHLWKQVQFSNQNCTWAVRAAEWENWLNSNQPA
jgi:glycosyltransferase involved in cell wall biosynthesis